MSRIRIATTVETFALISSRIRFPVGHRAPTRYTARMHAADLLARPLPLGPLTSPNRIVMPPLVIWKAGEAGLVTDDHLAHYARSAGAGLMIVEATTIAPEGRLAATQLGLWSDDHVPGLARLAGTIRSTGALAGIQIHHAGGSTSTQRTYGAAPRVPSLVDDSPEGAVEMTGDDVEATLAAFGRAVRRALEAGFQVIELHGAHGYLISQFLSPATNRRSDRWGGTPEKRRAFMVEAIAIARREVDDWVRAGEAGGRSERVRPALTIRLGVAASGTRELPIEEGLTAAEAAVEAGIDLLDVSNGGPIEDGPAHEIRERAGRIVTVPEWATPTLLLAALVKKLVRVPVVAVNGARTPEEAAQVVSGGIADAIAVGRATLADPRWARKALGADDRPIEVCRHCSPRCHWFREPPKCPARKRLAAKGEQPEVV